MQFELLTSASESNVPENLLILLEVFLDVSRLWPTFGIRVAVSLLGHSMVVLSGVQKLFTELQGFL